MIETRPLVLIRDPTIINTAHALGHSEMVEYYLQWVVLTAQVGVQEVQPPPPPPGHLKIYMYIIFAYNFNFNS